MDRDREKLTQEIVFREALAARMKDDPLLGWEPSEKQRPFIMSVLGNDKLENWFIAANRSGKSDAGAYCGAKLARFGVPNPRPSSIGEGMWIFDKASSGWVVSLDFPSSRDIIQPKYFDNGFASTASHPPFIPEREIAKDGWRVSDQILKLKNGSIIGFKSADSGRDKFQGTGKDWAQFDEEPPKDIYEETVIRVDAGKRLRIFGTCTILPPEGMVGGVSWLFPEIIQPWQSGDKPGVGLFGAAIYDNPHLNPAEIARLESIYPPGSTQRRIRLGGEWLPGLSGARMYAAFDRRIHVKPQAGIMPRRPLCWLWDFNVEPMISLIGQKDANMFRVLRELVADEGQISEMVDWFRSVVPSHSAEILVYGDATGKRRTNQTGQSDYALIMNHMRSYGAVRLRVPEENPLVRDRVNAVNRAMRNEFGEVCVQIDPSCTELIADFEQVVSDGRGGIRKTNNRKDPYFRRTHTSDAFGYWVAWDAPVTTFTGPARQREAVRVGQPGYAVGG